MLATNRKLFLLVFSFTEIATGLGLLVLPDIVFAILLGLKSASVEAIFIARIAGAALVAIGVASWMAKSDAVNPTQFGLLAGILIYNTTASILLAYAGVFLKFNGVLLWPAVTIHAILAVWGFSCLRRSS
jgi:hypothetical protein